MNEDKLKELETKFPYHKEVIELITTYRQLGKGKTELLAALKDIRDIAALNEHWSISRIRKLSGEAYTKHKGE